MQGRLIAHEWRLLRREWAFWGVALLMAALLGLGGAAGASWLAQQRATLAAIDDHDERLYATLAEQVRRLDAQGPPEGRPFGGMAWYLLHDAADPPPAPHLDPRRPEAAGSEWVAARYATLPPDPFGVLSTGQSDLHPYYTRITIRTRPALVNSDEIENPVALLSGRFDLAFVLVCCWPLVALPLLYDIVSRERDDRTLLLVLAQPIALRQTVLAKAVVRAGVLLALTLGVTFGAMGLAGGLAGPGVLLKALVLAGAVLANALLWIGVAVLVNSFGWRSATNAVAIAGVWLAWIFAVPALVTVAVATWAPVPSRVEFVSAMREATAEAAGDVGRLVAHYYEEHPELAPPDATPDRNAVRSIALQEEAERRVAPVSRGFERQVRAQHELAGWLAYLSPAILLQGALSDLAGTSSTQYARFQAQVDAFHIAWRGYFHPRIYARRTLSADDYRHLPRFAYQPEPTASVAGRATAAVGIVAAAGAVAFLIGVRRLRHYAPAAG